MRRLINLRQFCYYFFTLAVAVAIFAYLFSHVSLREIADLIQKTNVGMFFLFIVISLTGTVFRTWRYRAILQTSENSSGFFALYLVALVRNLFSDLLPARIGSLVYVYIINTRLGIPFGAAISSFALAFIFDIIALALLIISVALIVSAAMLSPVLIVSSGTALGVLSVVILYKMPIFFITIGKMIGWVTWIPAARRSVWQKSLDSAAIGVTQAYKAGIYFKILIISLCVRLCKYLSLYVLLLALVHQFDLGIEKFPFPKVFLGLCTAEFAASLPVSGIAGFGVYEGAWVLVFQLLGYSKKLAILTSVSHHLITQIFGYSIGAIALLLLILPYFDWRNKYKNKPQSEQPKSSWMNKIILLAVCQIVALSVFNFTASANNHDQMITVKQVSKDSSSNDKKYESNELIQLLSQRGAKIVYQCNDGLCKKLIGGKTPVLLTNRGAYPRWSPDGRWVAFIRGKAIMRMSSDGKNAQVMAKAQTPRAVAWSPDGREVVFTNGKSVKAVHIDTLAVDTLITGSKFLEIDMAYSSVGNILAATVKTLFSYQVKMFNLKTGQNRTIARGCSASLSPEGLLVTVNADNHEKLDLYWVHSGVKKGQIDAPHRLKFDNQYWSNKQDWIVSKSEGIRTDIFVHYVHANRAVQVTFTGDCDRPDLYIASD
ncbi:lysylphosphatidylglycerol synthase domain-containing protein [Desulfococcaceae bacterium HSG7]|nr:lysylphosphatidylglycerol synthase domain-containing protein [Desulfococcaceae bacterium HSG7]